jgi:hypothetical protein
MITDKIEFYMYTAKGLRRSSAFSSIIPNRVFVVSTAVGGKRLAWKFEQCKWGIAFLSIDLIASTIEGVKEIIQEAVLKGFEPTALFEPDSFYRKVTLNEIIKEGRK